MIRKVIIIAAVLIICGCAGAPETNCNKILNNRERDDCQYNKSMIQASSVLCRDITNDTMKSECIDRIALRLLDYLPCKQQDKQVKKDECESKVSDARRKAREANPDVRLP
jgi:hypothetical protein